MPFIFPPSKPESTVHFLFGISTDLKICSAGNTYGGVRMWRKLSHSIPIAQNAHTTKQHFEVKRPESPPSLQSGPATFLGVRASVMRLFPDPSRGKMPAPWSPASSGNRRLEKNSVCFLLSLQRLSDR